MTLSDKNFYLLWAEAQAAADRDTYVSDWSTSIIWGDADALTDDDLITISARVGQIWDVAHMTMRDLRSASGLTQAAFATRFCMPLRTVENWCGGASCPPDYVRLLIAESLGLISR